MFPSISRSWQLVKASWAFLRTNKSFVMFPILSAVATLIAVVVLLLPASIVMGIFSAAADTSSGGDGTSIFGLVLLFFFYLVMYTISIYFNVALTGAILKEMEGVDVNVGYGLSVANSKLGRIIEYAAISATVGVILKMLENKGGIVGFLFSSLGGIAWSLGTFFIVPLMIVEDKGVFDLIKDSVSLLKRTFGEQIAGGAGVGLIVTLASVALILVGVVLGSLFQNSGVLLMLLGGILVVGFVVIILIGSMLSAVYKVMVFRWAQTGEMPGGVDESMLRNAFRSR